MKNFLQGLGFIIIVIGGFWVGMQWGSLGNSTTPPPTIDYQHVPTEPVDTDTVQTPVPAETSVAPAEEPPVSATISTDSTVVVPVTSENVTVDIPTPKNDKVIHYQSNYFKYGFDIPANVYYSAFGGQDGAVHTVGIAKADPATLADAAVRVYFYGKKIVPELQNATKVVDPAGKFIYLLINGQYSVKIEANNINNPIVQTIAQSISVQ